MGHIHLYPILYSAKCIRLTNEISYQKYNHTNNLFVGITHFWTWPRYHNCTLLNPIISEPSLFQLNEDHIEYNKYNYFAAMVNLYTFAGGGEDFYLISPKRGQKANYVLSTKSSCYNVPFIVLFMKTI